MICHGLLIISCHENGWFPDILRPSSSETADGTAESGGWTAAGVEAVLGGISCPFTVCQMEMDTHGTIKMDVRWLLRASSGEHME